jgi:hypothetical protein
MTDSAHPEDSPEDARLQRLQHRYALAARAHHEALELLDEGRAEAQARMLSGLHAALLAEGTSGAQKLLELIDSSDPVLAGMAAVHLIHKESGRCLAALRRVAAEPGLLGFRAEMAIQRWESGDWEQEE